MEIEKTNEEDVLTQLVISEDISEEMKYQASLFASMAFKAAYAEEHVARKKLALELLEADLDTKVRAEMTTRGEKIREAAVEAAIHQNSQWESMYNSLLDDKLEHAILVAAVEAFRERSMMLSGLGALKRAELDQEAMVTKANPARATQALADKFNRNMAAKKNAQKRP